MTHDQNHAYLCAVEDCPKYVGRQTTNEAAERLRANDLRAILEAHERVYPRQCKGEAERLDAALAAERRIAETEARRATVERIRPQVAELHLTAQQNDLYSAERLLARVFAILDEEAAR